jgi:hypothetical protein
VYRTADAIDGWVTVEARSSWVWGAGAGAGAEAEAEARGAGHRHRHRRRYKGAEPVLGSSGPDETAG